MMPSVRLQDLWPLIEEAFVRDQTITIPVTGNSMQPTLEHGDAVTLQKISVDTVKRGDVLLYRRANGQFVLHRVVNVNTDTVDFCGDAQVSVERAVPKTDLLARVIAYERKGRRFDEHALRKAGERRLRSRRYRALKEKVKRVYRTEKQQTHAKTPLKFIFSYLNKYIGIIVLLCVLAAVSAAGSIGMTMVSGRVINKALYDDMNNFKEWFFLLMILLCVVCVCHFLYSRLRARIIVKVKNEIREDLFALLLVKQYNRVQKIHSGEILNRFTDDLHIVVDTAVSLIPHLISLFTKLVGGILFLFWIDPWFTLVLIVCGVLFSVFFKMFSQLYKGLHRECQETEGRTRSYIQECVENLLVIKSFANESGTVVKLREYQSLSFRKQLRKNTYASMGNSLMQFGFMFAYYVAMAWGILQMAGVFNDGVPTMLVGTFVVILQIMEQIRTPFRSASGLLPQYYAMLASAERLQDIADLPEEERAVLMTSHADLYKRLDKISLRKVSFAYQRANPVLRDFDFTLPKGKLSVIVGSSGSGKTTLIKLLLGLMKPQSGTVSLDLSDGETMTIDASTRGLFAYVPQGNMLLSGTIAENIAFGNNDYSQEDMQKAISLSCLSELVDSLEHGIETRVGERGVGLSEGQIQRVAIARALLSHAPVLLLDECTSALDMATEEKLIANLKTLDDRTILFISHRDAVLKSADHIIRVEKLDAKR